MRGSMCSLTPEPLLDSSVSLHEFFCVYYVVGIM